MKEIIPGFFLNLGYADPPPLRSGHIYMKDANSAELNEKKYFRFFQFLFFDLWLAVFKIYGDTPGVPPTRKKSCSKVIKFTGKMRKVLERMQNPIFSF